MLIQDAVLKLGKGGGRAGRAAEEEEDARSMATDPQSRMSPASEVEMLIHPTPIPSKHV